MINTINKFCAKYNFELTEIINENTIECSDKFFSLQTIEFTLSNKTDADLLNNWYDFALEQGKLGSYYSLSRYLEYYKAFGCNISFEILNEKIIEDKKLEEERVLALSTFAVARILFEQCSDKKKYSHEKQAIKQIERSFDNLVVKTHKLSTEEQAALRNISENLAELFNIGLQVTRDPNIKYSDFLEDLKITYLS